MIDLHVHTTASDGTFSPEEVVRRAAEKNLSAIAITDHDTTAGIQPAQDEGVRTKIEVVSGIEISSHWGNGILHILGYFLQLDHPELVKTLHFLQRGRHERIPKILSKLNKHGIHVSLSEVESELSGGVPGRPHVANAMVKKGYVKNIQEAFDVYLRKGAPAYIEKVKLSPAEAVSLVARTAKICVLAHPYTLNAGSPIVLEEIVRRLMSYGLGGIEAYYPEHTAEQTRTFLDLASKLNLAISGGSDFHGSNKPEIEMGVLPGIGALPHSVLSELKRRACNESGHHDPPRFASGGDPESTL